MRRSSHYHDLQNCVRKCGSVYLWNEADIPGQHRLAHLRYIVAVYPNAAASKSVQITQAAEQSGLSSSIWTEDAENVSFIYGKGYIFKDISFSIIRECSFAYFELCTHYDQPSLLFFSKYRNIGAPMMEVTMLTGISPAVRFRHMISTNSMYDPPISMAAAISFL